MKNSVVSGQLAVVRPCGDRVLLELIADAKVSAGGIALPDNLKLAPGFTKRARVLGVGPKCCKRGLLIDQVVHAVWNCGVPVPMDLSLEAERRLIKEEDIVAVETAPGR